MRENKLLAALPLLLLFGCTTRVILGIDDGGSSTGGRGTTSAAASTTGAGTTSGTTGGRNTGSGGSSSGTTSATTSSGGTSSGASSGTSSGGAIDLFYPPVNYPVAKPHAITAFQDDGGVVGLAAADYFFEYTGDGIGDGLVSILIGTGTGTFQAAFQVGTPGSALDGICAADFDGDGLADLAVGSGNAGTPIGIFFGADRDGGSTFSGQGQDMSRVHQLACGSIYGSGHPDLVVSTNDGVYVGQRAGATGFTWGGPYGPGDPRASVVANLGYTALSQIAVADPDDNQVVVLGTTSSDAGFETVAGPWLLPPGAGPLDIAAADFNGDGCVDLATSDESGDSFWVTVFLNQCPGGANPIMTSYPLGQTDTCSPGNIVCGPAPQFVVAADVNGDGTVDLVIPFYDALPSGENVAVLLGKGDGTFGAPFYLTAGQGPVWAVAADFNGDGKIDLAVSNWLSDDVSVFIQK